MSFTSPFPIEKNLTSRVLKYIAYASIPFIILLIILVYFFYNVKTFPVEVKFDNKIIQYTSSSTEVLKTYAFAGQEIQKDSPIIDISSGPIRESLSQLQSATDYISIVGEYVNLNQLIYDKHLNDILSAENQKNESYMIQKKNFNEQLSQVKSAIDSLMVLNLELNQFSENLFRTENISRNDLLESRISLFKNNISGLNTLLDLYQFQFENNRDSISTSLLINSYRYDYYENLNNIQLQLNIALEQKNAILYSLTKEYGNIDINERSITVKSNSDFKLSYITSEDLLEADDILFSLQKKEFDLFVIGYIPAPKRSFFKQSDNLRILLDTERKGFNVIKGRLYSLSLIPDSNNQYQCLINIDYKNLGFDLFEGISGTAYKF